MRNERKQSLKHPLSKNLLALAIAGAVAGFSGCTLNGDDGDQGLTGASGPDGSPAFPSARIYVASNSSGDASVRVRDENLGLLNTYTTGANEGLLVTPASRLMQAGDLMSTGRIVTACNAPTRTSADPSFEITGGNTTLASPKGMARIATSGLTVVANVGAQTLLVFGDSAAGNVAPVATIALPANAWDVVYDATSDRLFAALTDGTVGVFDDFSADFGVSANGPTRTFAITDSDGETSVNLHGIDYEASSDRLVVSDVGQASSATDGKLYVVSNASTADGTVAADTTIKGSDTRFGNPVDLQLTGTDVRIAEKANGGGAILVYRNIFEVAGGNVAADLVLDTPAPESIEVITETTPAAGVTDVSDSSTSYSLLYTSNPGANASVQTTSRNLDASALAFTSGLTSVENITLDRDGNAYLAYDDGTQANSGIAVVGAIDNRDPAGALDMSRDRLITGSNTRLLSPKGIELADDLGLMIVAEQGGAEVLVFSLCDSGNATPVVVNTAADPVNNVAPWDSDYAPSADTLFVALTNGTVAAYDDFSADMGAGGPDRIITPAMAGVAFAAPTNLHGIRYHQESDTLIVADVGSGASNSDGALMTLPGASSAEGLTNVGKRIANPGTLADVTGLGNPVDIAFDGKDLFVAEKANGAVQVWRDFLTDSALDGNVAPSDSLAAVAPESIIINLN
ncbi:hypothetical protein FWJ25_02135 [Marinobacter salinexigens]|uniref:NHL repeat containing protein n=1 Tax=Marinobacter salinexigens TaxID=2919747 RepID=A0A5B0VMM2_9GAMM|nr:hypothetical protein [Marinobacter salinexigens]KAA1175952.1 hypothetical protein FWJ25_02135 [Marinobacter salinexigens]